jgi:tetratricopeptide (TPR) repeat protein
LAVGALLADGTARFDVARAEPLPASPNLEGALTDTAETLPELTRIAKELGTADRNQRARAFETLRGLTSGALPAIAKRLDAIAQRGFDAEATLKAMSELRRIQGFDAPDADVDLARGVLPLLTDDRGKGAILAAELVALLRALEAERSLEAAELIVGKLWVLDSKLFRYEAPRTRTRLGVLMIPAFLRHRSHPRSHVRAACEEGLAQLAITGPGRAVQQDDVALLAAILTAYGDTLTFDAMPVVVTYLSDERVEVRRAALHAVARYGKNAIWQLRERYVNATGKDADPSWGHQRLRDELLRMFEAPKVAEFSAAMASAERALGAARAASGERDEEQQLAVAQAAADAALRVLPVAAQAARAAPVYDALAQHFEARGELTRALSAISRALRLAPNDPQVAQRRARALLLEAELRLSHGQVDLKSYERALALDPSLHEAQAALDELTGKSQERARNERRTLGGLAALLLIVAGIFLLRDKRGAAAAARATVDDEVSRSHDPEGQSEAV